MLMNVTVQILYPEKKIYQLIGSLIVIELIVLGINAIRLLPTIHFSPMCTVEVDLIPVLLYG